MTTQALNAFPHLPLGHYASGMRRMDVPEIIRALLRVGKLNQGELGERLGVKQSTISRWLSAKQLPDFHQSQRLRAYASEMGVLTLQDHELTTSRSVEIVGFVGLGEEIEWISEGNVPLDLVDLPFPVPEGCIALEARGDSMAPRVRNGEVVVIRVNGHTPGDLMGQEAVVKLRDGPYLFKTIRRGYSADTYNLESFNGPLREDVDIEWVGELWAIIPAKRWVRSR